MSERETDPAGAGGSVRPAGGSPVPRAAPSSRPFARALGYFPQVRRRWLLGMACVPLGSGLPLAVFWIVARIIDGMNEGTMSSGAVVRWCLLGLGLTLVAAAAKYGMRLMITGASRDFERIYRQDLFDHLMTLTPHDLADVRTGDVMSRSVADIEAVRMLLGPAVMYNAQALVVVPAALVAMALIDPVLMAVMLVPFFGLAAVIKIAARPTQHWSQITQERLADVSTAAQESFAGVRVVKAFATEPATGRVFRRMGERLLESNLHLATLRGITSAAITGVKELGVLAIVLIGGWHVVQQRLTVGELTFFIGLLGYALWPLIAIGWMLGMYHRAKAGYERLEELFALRPSVPDDGRPADPDRLSGEITVSGLSFAWDGIPTLEDVGFTVPAGTTLGVTGRTGCGKSTLVQLLTRLVEPPPGTVFLDGRDIREIDLARLRRDVAVVPQDTFLFSETIGENIAFAGPHIGDETVRRAAEAAQVDADIRGFPHGYDEILGERGVTLSGGQRQRTAIARALATGAPVLVLDDCLSAVDAVTEQAILRGLREALADRTAIVVSHRVAALSLADQVIVLDEGRLAEQGTHEELLSRGGLYAEIAERQRLEAEIAEL